MRGRRRRSEGKDETQRDGRTESTFLQQIAVAAATITVLTGRTTLNMTQLTEDCSSIAPDLKAVHG